MTEILRLLVVADATERTGYGHLSRCLNIAESLRTACKQSMITFCGEYCAFAEDMLGHHSIPWIPRRPYAEISQMANDFDVVLIDSYTIGQDELNAIGIAFKSSILVDDFGRMLTNEVTGVLNFTILAEKYSYGSKHTALGLHFFPASLRMWRLRKERVAMGRRSRAAMKAQNFLVFIGGRDIHGVGPKAVQLLDELVRGCRITYIGDFQLPKHGSRNTIVNHSPVPSIVELLRSTDIVISGGGLLKYEAAFCTIPNGTVTQTPEQYLDTVPFADAGLTVDLSLAWGLNENVFCEGIRKMMSESWQSALRSKSAAMFSGHDPSRIGTYILGLAE